MKPKVILFLLLEAVLAPQILHVGYAQEAKQSEPVRPFSPAEAQVLALGRQYNRNAIIDATDVPVTTPAGALRNFPTSYPPNFVMYTFTQQFEWSFLDFTPNTYLFWQEPDEERIAGGLAQGEGYGVEQGVVPPATIGAGIQEYLKKNKIPITAQTSTYTVTQKATGLLPERKKNVNSTIEFSSFTFKDLPVELQRQIAPYIAQKTIATRAGDGYLGLWLRDELWTQARIFYVSPPKHPELKTLFAAAWLQTPEGPQRIVLNLRQGGGSALPYDAKRDAGSQVKLDKAVDATTLGERVQLLSLTLEGVGAPAADTPPVFLPNPLSPSGRAFDALNSKLHSPSLPLDDRLSKPLTFEATRLSLADLLQRVEQETGVAFLVDTSVAAPTHLVSLSVKDLAARDVMLGLARLYGLTWNQQADGTYTLKSALLLPLDKELLRLGSPETYQVRDFQPPLADQDDVVFDDLARQIIDEAGPGIMQMPGVPLSTLSPETQQKIRARPRHHLLRHLMDAQNQFLQYEADDLQMNYVPYSTFNTLSMGGRARKTSGVTIELPRPPLAPPELQGQPARAAPP